MDELWDSLIRFMEFRQAIFRIMAHYNSVYVAP